VHFASDKEEVELPMGSKDKHLFVYAPSLAVALELVKASGFDMAFFNVSLLDDKPDRFVSKIRNYSSIIKGSEAMPIVLFGKEEDPVSLRKFMNSGIADYLSLPLDAPVFLQKFDLFLTGKVDSSDKQLYSQRTTKTLDLGFVTKIEEMSEFGVTIITNKPVEINECVVFRGESFGDKIPGEILARCYSVTPHSSQKGFFQVTFTFFGLNSALLQHIRRWIRLEYAKSKQEAA
jgi:hypothetical protein